MQIIGKKSKILLIAVAIVMLVAVGVSFAMWDTSVVNATNGNLSTYANAKVGDVITFGEYYQDINLKDETTGEYKKTPIEWIVVDKDERTGQLTLMSKYILACGSYFGNWYNNGINGFDWHYSGGTLEVGGVPYNQAYIDCNPRAFLNNLERLDLGGDLFDPINGYIPSGTNSTFDKYEISEVNKFIKGTGLLSSIGFSNQRYWTGYNTLTAPTLERKSGIYKRPDALNDKDKNQYYEFYYQRPIGAPEYKARPVTRGFLDEAFNDEQKSMIVPKQISGYIGHRWPDNAHDISTKSYVEGAVDKVWLPSATELNVINGIDWNGYDNDKWTNSSDDTGSTVFEYFKNYSNYTNPVTNTKNSSLTDAVKTVRTSLAKNGMVGNYSIPVYDKGTTNQKTAISTENNINTSDHYWTRSPASPWYTNMRVMLSTGRFSYGATDNSNCGVRPCIILKY